jgi:hypothetical protein
VRLDTPFAPARRAIVLKFDTSVSLFRGFFRIRDIPRMLFSSRNKESAAEHIAQGVIMKALIERQLHNPALVIPMVSLMQVMVEQDFNLGQVGFVVATKSVRAALRRSRKSRHAAE